MAIRTSYSPPSNDGPRAAALAVRIALLCAIAVLLYAVPGRSSRPPHTAAACGSDLHPAYTATAFHEFSDAVRQFNSEGFTHFNHSGFGGTFERHLPLRRIAAALSIYGYDYIGTYDDYALFYRRPVGWVQTTSIPRLTAPNGELLPPIHLPADLDPEWPSPSILAQTPPFIGATILPQAIVAYPCTV